MILFKLIMVCILIFLTAFFVAAEFAIVKTRSTRIEHLLETGNKKAADVKKILNNLDGYLSACQLGITVTALGLGWLGEPTVGRLVHPLFEKINIGAAITPILSITTAFFLITFLHVVVGELAPKTIAIQRAEAISLLLAKPLILFYKIMYPFIWLLNGSARLFIRLFGFRPVKEHEVAHSEEEVRLILSESYKSGEINQSEMMYVNNIFDFDDRLTKEIMIPRTEMVCFFVEDSWEENIEVVRKDQFTRYPVADGDKDHIIGLVNIKNILTEHFSKDEQSIRPFIRPIMYVTEATPIKQVLLKMQKERLHMAIVIDEYGGTAGLVTVEDILEEIVGEIQDEFDDNELPMIEQLENNELIIDGKVLLDEINELLNIQLNTEEVDTIGGWIITNNLDASIGTRIEYSGYAFVVEDMDGHQIKKVKVIKK
ncbi:hemolysin family protein [Virgibacillus sp. W0430]|uniref:hemolysin family protein n=1 Tax=Virgibacillus sp. W0430 TaxID=3391580 RepID=UPI003F45550F